jgi:putative transposase
LSDSDADPPIVEPSRVVVDETVVQIGEKRCWLYAAINLESTLLLECRHFPNELSRGEALG